MPLLYLACRGGDDARISWATFGGTPGFSPDPGLSTNNIFEKFTPASTVKGDEMGALIGDDDGTGFGVEGTSNAPRTGNGVVGISSAGDGVFGQTSSVLHKVGVHGVHKGHINAIAVLGELDVGTAAVKGQQGGGSGVGSDEVGGSGVWGDSTNGPGVAGTSSAGEGVLGEGATFGVRGKSDTGDGVFGESKKRGVVGQSSGSTDSGVVGVNTAGGAGVMGISAGGNCVSGRSLVTGASGVYGETLISGGIGVHGQSKVLGGIGVLGESAAGGLAGHFSGPIHVDGNGSFAGDVEVAGKFTASGNLQGPLTVDGDLSVTGDVVLTNRDLAEQFPVSEAYDTVPGTVMVIGNNGDLTPCGSAYDKRAIGLISGAGALRAAITLGAGC